MTAIEPPDADQRIAMLERQLRRARVALREAEGLLETRARELERSNRELMAREQALLERLDTDNRMLLEAERIGNFATIRETRDAPAIASAPLSDLLGMPVAAGFRLAAVASQVHALDQGRFRDFVHAATGDGPPAAMLDFAHRLRREAGPPRWLRWRLQRRITGDGQFLDITGTVQDISEPRAAGRRVQTLQLLDTRRTRRMLRLARDVESAERARIAFLALMSHDVRTPMTGLLGMLSLLGATSLTADQRRQVGLAQRGAEQLRLLLDEIIRLAEDDSGQLALEQAPLALRSTLESIVDFWRSARPDAAARVTLAIDPGAPEWVSLDPTRFRQVVDNLVSDALERSGERVAVALGHRPGWLRLGVDGGPAGAAANSNARNLAIAVCQRIVDALGGRLARTTTAAAERIEIGLPVRIVEPPEHDPATEASRILVVDDVETNRLVVCGMLRLHGIETVEAADGVEAVARATEGSLSAIIMDIAMPEMDGLEATRRIRALPGAIGKVPIIGLTAHAGARERDAAIAAGMNVCLSRPIDRQTLTLVVDRHLGRTRASATPAINQNAFRDIFDRFDPAARATLFHHFEADLADQVGRLAQAVAAVDATAAGRAVHSLTGIAGTFGLEALRRLLPATDSGGTVNEATLAEITAAAQAAVAAARQLLSAPPTDGDP